MSQVLCFPTVFEYLSDQKNHEISNLCMNYGLMLLPKQHLGRPLWSLLQL